MKGSQRGQHRLARTIYACDEYDPMGCRRRFCRCERVAHLGCLCV